MTVCTGQYSINSVKLHEMGGIQRDSAGFSRIYQDSVGFSGIQRDSAGFSGILNMVHLVLNEDSRLLLSVREPSGTARNEPE